MLRTLFRRNIFLLSVAIITLMAVLGVAVSQLFQTSKYMDEISRSTDRLIAVRHVQRMLNEAETSQRGYLLTGENRYLLPYRQVDEEIIPYFERVLQKYQGKGAQTARVKKMQAHAIRKLSELKRAIEAKERGEYEAALDAVAQSSGETVSDDLRRLTGEALAEEGRYQEKLRSGQDRGLWLTTALISGGCLLSVAVAVNAYLLARRGVRVARVQQRLVYQRRRAVQADREKSRFLANMSHEIRTPMNAILGFSQLLQDEAQTPRAQQYVKAISAAGESLLGLINDVLDLSKIESGRVELHPEVMDVREVAESLRLMLSQKAGEKGLDLRVEVDGDCPRWLTLDVTRFRQMLLNLLSNALKFTMQGRVVLRIHALPEKDENGGASVVLQAAVEDTGPGIAAGDFERIFLPFRQGGTHSEHLHGGTGLGLSITRRLVQLMGGTVELSSRPGHGSTFTLTIPNVEAPPVAPDTALAPAEGETDLNHLPPLKVLIVDDNACNREVLGGFFRDTHHTVIYAADGLEGVETALRERPEVILMDIRMPRLDGREARTALRRRHEMAATPIIAVTASSMKEVWDTDGETRRFDGYLRKPFLRPQLFTVIRGSLERLAPERLRLVPGILTDSGSPAGDGGNGMETENPSPGEAGAGDFSALLPALRDLEKHTWPLLSETMGMRAVESFAGALLTLSSEHDCPPLRRYAERLRAETSAFEISRMEQTLKEFPLLVQSLR